MKISCSKNFIALVLGLVAYVAFPSVDSGGGQAVAAAPLMIREALELVDIAVWTHTYEGYALVDRAMGRAIYSREDLSDLARALESPKFRRQLPELQDRLVRLENAYRAGEGTWGALTRAELSQAPLRIREELEFIPAEAAQYERLRDAFLSEPTWEEKGEIVRDVQVFLRGDYRPFQNDLLARVESLGMVVKANYRNSTLLVGRAPQRSIKALSGLDGVSRVHALERSARPSRNGAAATDKMAPMDYVRGVSIRPH